MEAVKTVEIGRVNRERFYSRNDLLAAGITWLVAFIGYLCTLAPGITLDDSGEFITAAYTLGVPHSPGYPVWTICAWLWTHLFPFGNIAWRVNLMSALVSSLACGLLTLLVSRSGRTLCRIRLIVLASSISAGLLLAFSPVMWSQGVAAGVYGTASLCFIASLLLLYHWNCEPTKFWRLYAAALVWGIALTVHQTLILLVVVLPMFIWFSDRKLGRDLLIPVLSLIVLGVIALALTPHSIFREGAFSGIVVLIIGVGAGVWAYKLIERTDWNSTALTILGLVGLIGFFGGLVLISLEDRPALGILALIIGLSAAVGGGLWARLLWGYRHADVSRAHRTLLIYLAVIAGLSFYAYLYFSACTNPPMNWGHCSTWDAFKHHFTRGQWDKIHPERDILRLWSQLNMFFGDLQAQFNIVYALLALLVLFFFRDLQAEERKWMRFLLFAFLFLGLGFLFLSNPSLDRQKQMTDRVFFLPCHCIYAMWIGYGLMLGLGHLLATKPEWQRGLIPAAALVLVLPVASVVRNWSEVEKHGHEFGYRYGYLMFKPGGEYPEMERGAVLFGGTDPGRLVPTYLIYAESVVPPRVKTEAAKCPESRSFDRRDVYIITQNALADASYLASLRDQYGPDRPRLDDPATLTNRSGLYRALFAASWRTLGRETAYPGEPLWIPSERDSAEAFSRYVEELATRPRQPGEEVTVENGHVRVTGIVGIMAINGMLTHEIFENNKARHTFYVEESYVLPWMNPYLEPAGVIMKLNPQPLAEITPAMVARDKAYWGALFTDLTNDLKFLRDDVARKSFSKLRAAIGGLYASRHMTGEAEYALQQAIQLFPEGPEANYRLAQLYVDEHRYQDATNLLIDYQKHDPYNSGIRQALEQVGKIRSDMNAIAKLEQELTANPGKLDTAMQLARGYAATRQLDELDALVGRLVSSPDLPQNEFLLLINFNAQLNRPERVLQLLNAFTQRYPENPLGWFNLAALLSLRGDCTNGMTALSRALALDRADQQVHTMARQDRRFANCRNTPEYQNLLATPSASSGSLPFRIDH